MLWEGPLRQGQELHLDPYLLFALLDQGLHDQTSPLHYGQRGVLEQPEQSSKTIWNINSTATKRSKGFKASKNNNDNNLVNLRKDKYRLYDTYTFKTSMSLFSHRS